MYTSQENHFCLGTNLDDRHTKTAPSAN